MAHIIVGLKAKNAAQKRGNRAIETKEKELRAARKPYVATKWARDMGQQIARDTDSRGNYVPSGSFLNQLYGHKGCPKTPDHAKQHIRDEGYIV